MDKTDTLVKTGPSGLLDVTVSFLGPRGDITPDVVLGCEVTIPDTPCYIREELELIQFPSKFKQKCCEGLLFSRMEVALDHYFLPSI